MDLPRQHTPHSPSQVASYIDGREHSAPPTPLSPVSPALAFHNASQVDGFPRHTTNASPMITSPVKPTKRKRLAKACDACHRSKRRCDGTSPCSNCDFASKPCTYTDPSGRAVAPPRTRSVDLRPGQLDSWPYPTRGNHVGDIEESNQSVVLVPTTLDPSPSPLDPIITRELVNLFFAQCHPATLMIHRSTLLYDLSRSRAPTYLLLAVFALAAPFSLQPSIRTGASRSWYVGEPFATRAISIVLNTERTVDLSDSLDSLRIRPCLELAQTLCLLQVHESVMRRPGEPNRFMSLARKVLQAIGVMAMDQTPLVSSLEDHIRNESMRRTFWFIFYNGLLSCAFTGRTAPVVTEEFSRLRLPAEEALFDLPRVDNRPGVQLSYDYLPLPVENKQCAGEFANLVRVTRLYAGVVGAMSQKVRLLQAWDLDHVKNEQIPSVTPFEVGLRRWLELLPDGLRLTQENLSNQLSQLDGGAGAGAWAFLYMHALAECTVLVLHEFANTGISLKAPRNLALREQKALENLTMILGALGQRGRANITVATLLVAIGKHYSPQDPQVATWFDEYFRMWGVCYDELMNNQFRASWCTVGSALSGSPQYFVDTGPSPFAGDLDYDMDFGASENMNRRLSISDSSSTGQSGNSNRIVDGSTTSLPNGRYFGLDDSLDLLQDLGGSSGPLGGLTNGVDGQGGFIAKRTTREHLPVLVTNGLTGRGGGRLNNHERESNQTVADSGSISGANTTFSLQTQGRYGSRGSPHSLSPYASQAIDDGDLTVDGLGWLADGAKMQ